MSSHSQRHTLLRPLFGLIAAGALLALPATGRAEEEAAAGTEGQQPVSLQERTSTAFLQLKPVLDAKNWDEALKLLDGAKAVVPANSYDMAVIVNTEGAIYLQGKNDENKALQCWEVMLRLAEQHHEFFPKTEVLDHYLYVANIYMQKASGLKAGPEQREYYDRSLANMKTYLAGTPRPKSDKLLFYASLLYYKAVSDPQHIDTAMLKEAHVQAQRGLLADAHPKDGLYQLLIAALQQDGDLAGAARYIQLLTKAHPTNKSYWQQLMAIYYNLTATSEKDQEKRRQYYARAINTVEQAQKLGFLNGSKENYDLVSMYTQVGQYGKATELLYTGLKSGAIEDTVENWVFLASFYQQIEENEKAIAVLKEADDLHPGTGEFDRQIGQIYYELENTPKVYEYCKLAAEKGNLKEGHGYAVYQLLSFAAYQIGKYQEALDSVNKAMSYPDSPKSLARLKEGILGAIEVEKANRAAVLGKPL